MPKQVSIFIETLTLDEVCTKLAKLTHHRKEKYTLPAIYNIINKYKPELIEPVITEEDLKYIADRMKKPGRPKNVDKNK